MNIKPTELRQYLLEIAQNEFRDVVKSIKPENWHQANRDSGRINLRFILIDESSLDFSFSQRGQWRYSYHWQQKDKIYRHDNYPDKRWKQLLTYPKHFHCGSYDNVIESTISDIPEEALREFLSFIRSKITSF